MSEHEQAVLQRMDAARTAQRRWRQMPIEQRLACVAALRKLIVKETEEWLSLLVEESKKTPTDSLTSELLLVASACRFYEKRAKSYLKPKKMPTPIEFFSQKSYLLYEPLGVIAIISPWNFPLQLSLIPLISAVIAGNAVILKPSEHTPRINAKIEQLLARCGFPEQLVQVLHGDGRTGSALIAAHPDKVFFTGGSAVGRLVYLQAAELMIPCDLELGGNDALIVCADANLERAAQAAVWGGFMHSGQVCVGVERVYVEQRVYEAFVERVVQLTGQLRQGLTADDDVGGMTTPQGFAKVRDVLRTAMAGGANVRVGATDVDQLVYPFFPPTVLTDVDDNMNVIREETFGPLLSIMPVADEHEAVRRVNQSQYGLNSYVFSRDTDKAMRIAAALETGNCYINDVIINIGNMHLPFGGAKASGFGRYHGAEGLYTFCRSKSVMLDRGRANRKFNWFPYSSQGLGRLVKLLRWLYGR